MSVARKISLRFERGGELTAELMPALAPKTVEAIVALLPLEVTVYHSRYCGREFNFPLETKGGVPRERQTSTCNTGDVVYWREWELDPADAEEAVGIYYGAEVLRDHRGYLPVNPFARIPQSQWERIEEIGLRIWQRGTEKLTVTMME
jgi:hypothetical protein